MPQNRAKSRTHHTQPQPPPQPSDYETDAPQIMDYPAPPPPARSTEELNFKVICRHYPDVLSVIHVAGYTVLYTYHLQQQQWNKADVEGTLFVCELAPVEAGVERYGVIILNRRSMENFYMEVKGMDGTELTDDFIMFQGDQVYGIWVFCEKGTSTANARTETWAKIEELAIRVDASKAAAQQNPEAAVDGAEQAHASVPMGRQLSLRELFGQQRTQDAAWSVINHHNAQAAPPSQAQHAASLTQPGQPDMLSQLFMKAKEDYNSR